MSLVDDGFVGVKAKCSLSPSPKPPNSKPSKNFLREPEPAPERSRCVSLVVDGFVAVKGKHSLSPSPKPPNSKPSKNFLREPEPALSEVEGCPSWFMVLSP